MPSGLYAILDPGACGPRGPLETAEAILAGGCAMLQLRWKDGCDRERLRLARALAALCARAATPFVVNDRPDLARLSGADGLHLGQDDLDLADARAIVGSLPIGRSCHSLAQLAAAESEGADLLALGPIFETTGKASPDPVVGLDALRAAARERSRPVIAIGGIDLGRAPAIAAAGAAYGAVLGGVCRAHDPQAAARALHAALRVTAAAPDRAVPA